MHKITNIVLVFMIIGAILRIDFAYSQDISTLRPSLSYSANNTRETIDRFNKAAMFNSGKSIRDLFEKRADVLGGKGAWDEALESLAKKIGFNTVPGTVRMSIQEIWADFIKQNRLLVDEGNNLIAKDIKENGKVTKETVGQLRKIIRQFVFPEASEKLIKSKTDKIKGKIIVRSSGRNEDSFTRNLAGIFSSPKRESEDLILQAVKSMLEQAIDIIWIQQNSLESKPIEGAPNILTSEEGFGALIQQFLDFDASGTAMSDYYGHTSIEAVIGDAEMAVRPVYANTSQFLFKKGSSKFEYNPSFLDTPYEFKLKGEIYSNKTNKDKLERAVEKYPRIKGMLSPLTNEQAIEVNRVINSLEDEIGVPVDVEWGYLDGKLYIVQVRPIIGDFRKPLVEKDLALDGKESIAATPIALGHTAKEGFTGKVVLFGSNVTQETIRQFEKETNASYIRVQHDVATKVLDGSTMAKVLVDVNQGSRQAHNINLISDRIAEGEFTYANGPVLRNGLEKNLDYIPHPVFKGIWISKEDVTYFSDGLKGSFYSVGEKGKAELESTERQEVLQAFHNRVKDIWDEGFFSFETEEIDLLNIIKEVIFKGEIRAIYGDMMLDLFSSNEPLEAIKDKIIMGEYTKEDLELIQPSIELLEEALSYPLYPHSWESRHMEMIRNLLVLKGINEALDEEKKKEEKVDPDKYRVILVDADRPKDRAIKILKRDIPDCDIIQLPTRAVYYMELELKKVDYNVSFFYAHIHGMDAPKMIELFTRIRRKNPDAQIFIDGLAIVSEDFDAFQKQYGKINICYRDINDKVLFGHIKADFDKWQEERISKPKYPEKLNVLVIADPGTRFMQYAEQLLSREFGTKEYELHFYSSVSDALSDMGNKKIDYCMVDWFGTGVRDVKTLKRLYAQFKGDVYGLRIFSGGLNAEEMKHYNNIKKEAEITDDSRIYIGSMRRPEDVIDSIKTARYLQIETYEQALAVWEKTHQEIIPQKPTTPPVKVNVLFVSDLPEYASNICFELSRIEEANVKSCFYASEAIDYIKNNRVDVVITDCNIPWDNADKSSGGELYTLYNTTMLLRAAKKSADSGGYKLTPVVFSVAFYEDSKFTFKYIIDSIQIYDTSITTNTEEIKDWSKIIQDAYHDLVEEYERSLEQRQPVQLETQLPTIFVIENSPSEASNLSEFIKGKLEEGYNVIKIDSMWSLKRELARQRPDLIITDTVLDNINERRDTLQIDYILELIKNKNPEAQFIITSDIAALISENRLKSEGFNILGIIEKPFYFQSVFNIIQDKKSLNTLLEKKSLQRSIDSGV